MSIRTAAIVFDQEFLAVRAKLIEVAASLDRIERAAGPPLDDPRIDQLRRATELLFNAHGNRAEQIQLAFSLPYNDRWEEQFKMTNDE